MDRIEIVDPGANGEAGFSIESKKWPAVEERVIMLSTAGTEYTLSKPSLCPYYGDHLKVSIRDGSRYIAVYGNDNILCNHICYFEKQANNEIQRDITESCV